MPEYVKPSIPRPVWDKVRAAAAQEGRTITAWLDHWASMSDGTDAPPAPATPPKKVHQGVPPMPNVSRETSRSGVSETMAEYLARKGG